VAVHVVFDYDGVVVDSYTGVEVFYLVDLPNMLRVSRDVAEHLLYIEYLGEAVGWLREDWWFDYIPGLTSELYDALITLYWERRIEYQKPLPGVKQLLEKLRRMGFKVWSVSYRDDIYGLKRYRIEVEGLAEYFDEIIVAGEDVRDRAEGLKQVLEKAGGEPVIYVDDKPLNLYKLWLVFRDKVTLVHHHYNARNPLYTYPWINPSGLFKTVYNLHELLQLITRYNAP